VKKRRLHVVETVGEGTDPVVYLRALAGAKRNYHQQATRKGYNNSQLTKFH